MIRFYYGAGTPKTENALLDAIRTELEAGREVLLLVPEQETVHTERRMAEWLSPAFQLSFEVLNFTRLANRVFRTAGGLSYRYATPGTQALFMWKTLRALRPMLRQLGKKSGNDLRLCEKLLSVSAQMKAYCVTPENLADASTELETGDPLSDKLFDISLLSGTYDTSLATHYDSVLDDLTRLSQLIPENPELFQNTVFVVDSFSDYTPQELSVLKELMKVSPAVLISTPLPDAANRDIHLLKIHEDHERLLRLAKENGGRVYFQPCGTEPPQDALSFLRDRLFKMDSAPARFPATGKIELTVCPSPYEEAEYAAAVTARLIRAGYRYSDITVVVRDAGAYAGILDDTLKKENIPYFFSEKTDITLRPLIRLILFALRIRIYNWQPEDVIGYLKTGLCGLPFDDINFFEEYTDTWQLRGARDFAVPFTRNPDGYTERISARGERILAAAERVRSALVPPLTAFFDAFEKKSDTKELCRSLYRLLLTLGVPQTLKTQSVAKLTEGDRREAEELSRLFSETVRTLEDVSRVLKDEEMDAAAFSEALRLVFSHTDIGTIPTSADAVLIGSAATLRAGHPRFSIVLGLNEGMFPQTQRKSGLLCDADERKLEKLGLFLAPDSMGIASKELYYVYRALSLPSEKLFVTYAKAGTTGSGLAPSFAVERLRALFPDLTPRSFEAEAPAERIFTKEGALSAFCDLSPEEQTALCTLLKEDPAHLIRTERLRIPVTQRSAFVSAKTAHDIFGAGAFNPTGLERFAACRFSYYCRSVLKLREKPKDTLDYTAAGIFLHFVLERVFREIRSSGRPVAGYSEKEIEGLAGAATEDFRAHLLEIGGGLSPRAQALTQRLSDLSRLATLIVFRSLSSDRFVPAFFELDLAGLDGAFTELPDGKKIPLSGKIDRVDACTGEDGNTYLRVTDYKTGLKKFDREEIQNGTCLQMPLYLYALCHGTHPAIAKELGLPGNTRFYPAGISYFSATAKADDSGIQMPREEALEAAGSKCTKSEFLLSPAHAGGCAQGKADPQDFSSLFEDLTKTVGRIAAEMQAGKADIEPQEKGGTSPCTFCPYGEVCRAANERKE